MYNFASISELRNAPEHWSCRLVFVNFNKLKLSNMIGFSKNNFSKVQPCTVEMLTEFDDYKTAMKKQLPVLTPHAIFKNGERKNAEAIPSGLSMYDIDHIENPRGYYHSMIADRISELGINMAHVTPSTEGLRLIFEMPKGMTLAEAQKWMSEQLNDANYDGSVKDYARCSYLVPRAYILYMDEEELLKDREVEMPVEAKPVPQNEVVVSNVMAPSSTLALDSPKPSSTALW